MALQRLVAGATLALSLMLSNFLYADATANDWVKAFIAQRNQVVDFEADVKTTIESAMFTEAQVQTGHLLQKGNDYRKMIFLTPVETTTISTPKEFISVDALGNVSRSPNDAGNAADWFSGTNPEAVFDQLDFTVIKESGDEVVLKGTPIAGGKDPGFSSIQARFGKKPVLLKNLELYSNKTKGLTMDLSYVTVKDLPVLQKTMIKVDMQPPGAEQGISLKTTVENSKIQVNHNILASEFEVHK